jgi:hypothetical protein
MFPNASLFVMKNHNLCYDMLNKTNSQGGHWATGSPVEQKRQQLSVSPQEGDGFIPQLVQNQSKNKLCKLDSSLVQGNFLILKHYRGLQSTLLLVEWGWNSGLHICKEGTLPLEPQLQSKSFVFKCRLYLLIFPIS